MTTGVPVVDRNADLGESFAVGQIGDDSALLSVVTSANNIACGFPWPGPADHPAGLRGRGPPAP